jgi:hypothetical protein
LAGIGSLSAAGPLAQPVKAPHTAAIKPTFTQFEDDFIRLSTRLAKRTGHKKRPHKAAGIQAATKSPERPGCVKNQKR